MSKPHLVTDHALVRYLERVYGLPVEEVREEIAALLAERVDDLNQVRSRLVEAHGFLYAFREGRCVTVLFGPPRHPRRERVLGELPEHDARHPASRPANDDDPWWWSAARGPEDEGA